MIPTLEGLLIQRNAGNMYKSFTSERVAFAGPAPPDDDRSLPYAPLVEDDFVRLLTVAKDGVQCREIQHVSTKTLNDRRFTKVGLEGPRICSDSLPQDMSPRTCRIYSIDPSPDNIFFELKMGRRGCRVHLITNITDMNYGRIRNNSFLYPLHLSPQPGNAHYTLDNFINLMSHELKNIHIVKTGVNASEWRLLNTLYSSRIQAWKFIQQLRMVVHVPDPKSSTFEDFSYKYLLLKGLRSLGYHLVYSQPLILEKEILSPPSNTTVPDLDSNAPDLGMVEIKPKIYETIWLKA
ncbi:uncharacterized protein LOC108674679 isoform X2 [Hyalella azteca]|uniref:Uncharacterized protein LOC108674679 isoform X2 n=1 Tax=Hyalella azteca TaxID=294128 RepID=A0A8B7NZ30_HYAAZ|nr:uncharacterized protein LOC108674679 isoform X2 [Hyalella azteca]